MNAMTDLQNATRDLAAATTINDKRSALANGSKIASSFVTAHENAIMHHGTAAQRTYSAWATLASKVRKEIAR